MKIYSWTLIETWDVVFPEFKSAPVPRIFRAIGVNEEQARDHVRNYINGRRHTVSGSPATVIADNLLAQLALTLPRVSEIEPRFIGEEPA